jgi:hypothetical protein
MNLENIKKMVEQDSVIDQTQLDTESLRLPQLHNKYLNLFHDCKLITERKRNEYYRMRRIKWEYYTGKLDDETLKNYGWNPFQLKILKQDLPIYMESDDDLIKLADVLTYYKELCNYLESVVKEITFRHNKIRNAIDWQKFLGGS